MQQQDPGIVDPFKKGSSRSLSRLQISTFLDSSHRVEDQADASNASCNVRPANSANEPVSRTRSAKSLLLDDTSTPKRSTNRSSGSSDTRRVGGLTRLLKRGSASPRHSASRSHKGGKAEWHTGSLPSRRSSHGGSLHGNRWGVESEISRAGSGNSATSSAYGRLGLQPRFKRSSSTGQLFLPASILTLADLYSETTNETTNEDSSSNSAQGRHLSSTGFGKSVAYVRDRSRQPSHNSQSSTTYSANSQPNAAEDRYVTRKTAPSFEGSVSRLSNRPPAMRSFSFRSFFVAMQDQEQQQQHEQQQQKLLQDHQQEMHGQRSPFIRTCTLEDLRGCSLPVSKPRDGDNSTTAATTADASSQHSPSKCTTNAACGQFTSAALSWPPGRGSSSGPDSSDECNAGLAGTSRSEYDGWQNNETFAPMLDRHSPQVQNRSFTIAQNWRDSSRLRSHSSALFQEDNLRYKGGCSSSSEEIDYDSSDKGPDAAPPTAFSIMAAAFGWSVSQQHGLAPFEGDVFAPAPALSDRKGDTANLTLPGNAEERSSQVEEVLARRLRAGSNSTDSNRNSLLDNGTIVLSDGISSLPTRPSPVAVPTSTGLTSQANMEPSLPSSAPPNQPLLPCPLQQQHKAVGRQQQQLEPQQQQLEPQQQQERPWRPLSGPNRQERQSAGVWFQVTPRSASGTERRSTSHLARRLSLPVSPQVGASLMGRPCPQDGTNKSESCQDRPSKRRGFRVQFEQPAGAQRRGRAQSLDETSQEALTSSLVAIFPDGPGQAPQDHTAEAGRRQLLTSKSAGTPKLLPYYSDLARHRGRYKALLVTSDEQKIRAIRTALPIARYRLRLASSKSECLFFLIGGGAKYMPDVVLLDSQLGQGAQVSQGTLDECAEGGRSSLGSNLERRKQHNSPPNSPALQLLACLREHHDPSVLPIILLAAIHPNPAMASIAHAVMGGTAASNRDSARAPGATAEVQTATASRGMPMWDASSARNSGLLHTRESLPLPTQLQHITAPLNPSSSAKLESSPSSFDTPPAPHSPSTAAMHPMPASFPSSQAPTSVFNQALEPHAMQPGFPISACAAPLLPQTTSPPQAPSALTPVAVPLTAGVPAVTAGLSSIAAPSTAVPPVPKSAPLPQVPSLQPHMLEQSVAASTSTLSAAQEGLAALRRGANDYVALPFHERFDPAELEARINMQVALRRAVRIKAEASSSMQLLRSMLPSTVIRKLKAGQKYIAQHHEQVTIGFIDVVGFTEMSAIWQSSRVAQMLNDLFSQFDDICDQHGVYHVDTIGDSYMVLCGHDGEQDHALRLLRAARDMLALTDRPLHNGEHVRVRIGLNSGSAHSGVLGTRRLKYTVWGDSVNCASRMESSGFPGSVQVSSDTYLAATKQMDLLKAESRGGRTSRSSAARSRLLRCPSNASARGSCTDNDNDNTPRSSIKSFLLGDRASRSSAKSMYGNDFTPRSSAKSVLGAAPPSYSSAKASGYSSAHSALETEPPDSGHGPNADPLKRNSTRSGKSQGTQQQTCGGGRGSPDVDKVQLSSKSHGNSNVRSWLVDSKDRHSRRQAGESDEGLEGNSSGSGNRSRAVWPVRPASDADTGVQGGSRAGGAGVPEFEFCPLGERPIKGKGMVSTYLVKVGDWVSALETYVRQQHTQQAWQPTPEGINAFRAGRTSGFADGYRAGYMAGSTSTEAREKMRHTGEGPLSQQSTLSFESEPLHRGSDSVFPTLHSPSIQRASSRPAFSTPVSPVLTRHFSAAKLHGLHESASTSTVRDRAITLHAMHLEQITMAAVHKQTAHEHGKPAQGTDAALSRSWLESKEGGHSIEQQQRQHLHRVLWQDEPECLLPPWREQDQHYPPPQQQQQEPAMPTPIATPVSQPTLPPLLLASTSPFGSGSPPASSPALQSPKHPTPILSQLNPTFEEQPVDLAGLPDVEQRQGTGHTNNNNSSSSSSTHPSGTDTNTSSYSSSKEGGKVMSLALNLASFGHLHKPHASSSSEVEDKAAAKGEVGSPSQIKPRGLMQGFFGRQRMAGLVTSGSVASRASQCSQTSPTPDTGSSSHAGSGTCAASRGSMSASGALGDTKVNGGGGSVTEGPDGSSMLRVVSAAGSRGSQTTATGDTAGMGGPDASRGRGHHIVELPAPWGAQSKEQSCLVLHAHSTGVTASTGSGSSRPESSFPSAAGSGKLGSPVTGATSSGRLGSPASTGLGAQPLISASVLDACPAASSTTIPAAQISSTAKFGGEHALGTPSPAHQSHRPSQASGSVTLSNWHSLAPATPSAFGKRSPGSPDADASRRVKRHSHSQALALNRRASLLVSQPPFPATCLSSSQPDSSAGSFRLLSDGRLLPASSEQSGTCGSSASHLLQQHGVQSPDQQTQATEQGPDAQHLQLLLLEQLQQQGAAKHSDHRGHGGQALWEWPRGLQTLSQSPGVSARQKTTSASLRTPSPASSGKSSKLNKVAQLLSSKLKKHSKRDSG